VASCIVYDPVCGNYVKLRPQSKEFLDISNPKAVLEQTLRTYTCLTVGRCRFTPDPSWAVKVDRSCTPG